MAKSKSKEFHGPKSICLCGHTGDGTNSEHSTLIGSVEDGTGECLVNGCGCSRFTWAQWTKKFGNFMVARKGVKR